MDIKKVTDYVGYTPHNVNLTILRQLVDPQNLNPSETEAFLEYVNRNRLGLNIRMVKTLLERGQISDTEILEPEKNIYGFYFNVPYVHEFNEPDFSGTQAYVFYENGDMLGFSNANMDEQEKTAELFYDGQEESVDYENLADSPYNFSEDGKILMLGDFEFIAQGIERGIYFGETYISNDGETCVPYATNKVIFGGWLEEQSIEEWKIQNHYGQNYGLRVHCSIDGTVIYAGSRYDGLKAYYYAPKPQLKAPIISISNDVLNISSVAGAGSYEIYEAGNFIISTSELKINLSQYIENKDTYLLVRAVGDGYKASDFSLIKHNIDFIPGLYEAGAIALYQKEGAAAINDLLITSWGELALTDYISQENSKLIEGSSALEGDLILPEEVHTIGQDAFRDCKLITGILLPEDLLEIEGWAFYGCEKMAVINIPNNVSLGDGLFYYCISLAECNIPDGIISLEETFDHCYALNSVSLPASLTSIGRDTFSDCSKLESITFRGTVDQWNTIQLYTNTDIGHRNWNHGSGIKSIVCIDGTVSIS